MISYSPISLKLKVNANSPISPIFLNAYFRAFLSKFFNEAAQYSTVLQTSGRAFTTRFLLAEIKIVVTDTLDQITSFQCGSFFTFHFDLCSSIYREFCTRNQASDFW
jgi:hypothetical protein